MPKIIQDLGFPEDASAELVWQEFPLRLTTWRIKELAVKQSRWFSWHDAASVQLPEFWSARMILEWYCGGANPDATCQQFNKMREDLGGLELAFKCLSQETFENAHVMYICSEPCRGWYSWHMKHVKTAQDNLRYQLHLSRSITWQSEWHLRELAELLSPRGWSKFNKLMISVLNPDGVAKKIFSFVTQLLGRRCASLSRHSSPPYCYVGLLGSDMASARAAGDLMISDLTALLHLEVSTMDQAQNLAADLRLTLDACSRLASMLLWDGHHEKSKALLKALLVTIPDSKCIEDCHQVVRVAQKNRGNEKMTQPAVQYLIENSKVLSQRDLQHGPEVTYDVFHDRFRGLKPMPRSEYLASKHKLDKVFRNIMGKRQWIALSEPNLAASAAAWEWLRYHAKEKLVESAVMLKDWPWLHLVSFYLHIYFHHLNLNLHGT